MRKGVWVEMKPQFRQRGRASIGKSNDAACGNRVVIAVELGRKRVGCHWFRLNDGRNDRVHFGQKQRNCPRESAQYKPQAGSPAPHVSQCAE